MFIKKVTWGLGIGDWGLGIGDWAQSPIPNPHKILILLFYFYHYIKYYFNILII